MDRRGWRSLFNNFRLSKEDAPSLASSPSPDVVGLGDFPEEEEKPASNGGAAELEDVAQRRCWTPVKPTGRRPLPRCNHAATVIGRRVIIVGGDCDGRRLNDIQVLHLGKLTWTELGLHEPAASPVQRLPPCKGHSLIPWGKTVLLVGGDLASPSDTVSVWSFDLEAERWTQIQAKGKIPASRTGQSVIRAGAILIMFGGEDSKGRKLNDIHVLDLKSLIWLPLNTTGKGPSPRAWHVAAMHNDRHFLVFGGASKSKVLNDLYALDFETMEWSRLKPEGFPPPARAGSAAVLVGDKWYICGGGDFNGNRICETITLDISKMIWTNVVKSSRSSVVGTQGLSLVMVQKKERIFLVAFGGAGASVTNEVEVLYVSPVANGATRSPQKCMSTTKEIVVPSPKVATTLKGIARQGTPSPSPGFNVPPSKFPPSPGFNVPPSPGSNVPPSPSPGSNFPPSPSPGYNVPPSPGSYVPGLVPLRKLHVQNTAYTTEEMLRDGNADTPATTQTLTPTTASTLTPSMTFRAMEPPSPQTEATMLRHIQDPSPKKKRASTFRTSIDVPSPSPETGTSTTSTFKSNDVPSQPSFKGIDVPSQTSTTSTFKSIDVPSQPSFRGIDVPSETSTTSTFKSIDVPSSRTEASATTTLRNMVAPCPKTEATTTTAFRNTEAPSPKSEVVTQEFIESSVSNSGRQDVSSKGYDSDCDSGSEPMVRLKEKYESKLATMRDVHAAEIEAMVRENEEVTKKLKEVTNTQRWTAEKLAAVLKEVENLKIKLKASEIAQEESNSLSNIVHSENLRLEEDCSFLKSFLEETQKELHSAKGVIASERSRAFQLQVELYDMKQKSL